MLQTLELTNIRSYKSGLFEFSDGVNIVVGPNASGKTNLLEAIYMVALGSAFKSEDAHMILRDAQWGRIDSTYSENHSRNIKLTNSPSSKTFIIDDVEKKRLQSSDKIPIVLFEPSHMLLLSREPDRRRTYIDDLLSQTEPTYSKILKDYRRVLAQRNRLLKQETLPQDHLFVWDVQMADLAGKIVAMRLAYVDKLQKQLSENYQSVSGNKEILEIIYESKTATENYANTILKELKNSFSRDRARGFSSIGPHRDDLKITLNYNDARESASRGETRSIILALKIAELKLLEEKTGKKPLLLLDDVFSELDGKRRRTLSETLQHYQTFITTTDADVVVDHFNKTCNIIPL